MAVMQTLLNKFRGKKSFSKGTINSSMTGYGIRSYMVMPGQAVWMDRDYAQFAREAYIKNVVAHRAIDMVSTAAASINLELYSINARGTRTEEKSHPILKLIKKPNPNCATSDFFQSLYNYYQISGNVFIQAVGVKDLPPSELHLLRPDRVSIVAGKGAMAEAYRYSVGNQTRDFPVNKITGKSNILHIR
ncbi:MAG: phage portal protein, partial [Rickettsiales bacterium]